MIYFTPGQNVWLISSANGIETYMAVFELFLAIVYNLETINDRKGFYKLSHQIKEKMLLIEHQGSTGIFNLINNQ